MKFINFSVKLIKNEFEKHKNPREKKNRSTTLVRNELTRLFFEKFLSDQNSNPKRNHDK